MNQRITKAVRICRVKIQKKMEVKRLETGTWEYFYQLQNCQFKK